MCARACAFSSKEAIDTRQMLYVHISACIVGNESKSTVLPHSVAVIPCGGVHMQYCGSVRTQGQMIEER